jgi:hypothetical protein
MYMAQSGGNFFDNINIYNTGDHGILTIESDNNFYKNITIQEVADDCVFLQTGKNAWFHTISCTDITDRGFNADDNFHNVVVNSATMRSVTGDEYNVVSRVSVYFDNPRLFVTDGSGNVTQYGAVGTISSDTTDARSGTAMKITPDGLGKGAAFYVRIGSTKVTSTASDLTLGIYLKKDGTFNGEHVSLFALQDSKWLYVPAIKAITTSYVQYTVVVDSADLVLNKYIDLFIQVDGTAGSIFVDDFSASQ